MKVSDEGVFVDGVLLVERDAIAEALLQPRLGSRPTVRLRDHRRHVIFELEVEDAEEGNRLLRTLGRDAATRNALFEMRSPVGSKFPILTQVANVGVGLLIGGLIFVGFMTPVPAYVVIAPIALLLVPMIFALRGQTLEVGADGLSFAWNGRRRFIPFDEVRAVETPGTDGVHLTLVSGERVRLRMDRRERDHARGLDVSPDRDALLRRIVEAMEARRLRASPRELAAFLAPRDRDAASWLEDLKTLRDAAPGYRTSAVREEDLWRLVEDPGAPEEARAAAALLLQKSDGAKPRLRIAADAVASPRLRVALEAEEEEEAEEALKAYSRMR